MWWGATGVSSALAIALGMWGCRYRELQPISFGGRGGDRGQGRGEEIEMGRIEDPRTK